MQFKEHVYRVLIISASEKFNEDIKKFLPNSSYNPIDFCKSINQAQRNCLDRLYDLILINTPLPDDFGIKFALDISVKNSSIVLLFVASEIYPQVYNKVSDYGVFVMRKPVSQGIFIQSLDWLKTMREKMKSIEKKSFTLKEKMEEIKLVNRAKWILINSCKMNEEDAHRYIEKQAMDRCESKKTIAESIIKTYE